MTVGTNTTVANSWGFTLSIHQIDNTRGHLNEFLSAKVFILAEQRIRLNHHRGPVPSETAFKVETLVQAHPLYQVLTSMPGIGVRTAAVFLGKTSRHRIPTGLLRRPRTSNQEIGLLHQGRTRLPRRQQKAQARHVPVRLRLTALRPRLPGLLPA